MSTSNVLKSNPILARRMFMTTKVEESDGYTCNSCHGTTGYNELERFFSHGQGNSDLAEQMNNDESRDLEGETGQGAIDHTLEVDYKCRTSGCDDSFMVKVSVTADAIYDSDDSDCGFGSSFNGWGSVDFMGIERAAQDEIIKKIKSSETFPIHLCIIAKTRFNAGFCYLGFSPENQCIIRPIYNTDVGNCCWGRDTELDVGRWYRFQAYINQKDQTVLPHSNNDLVVTNKYDEGRPVQDLYALLEPYSKQSIKDIFGADDKYVNEGTDCTSVGVLRIKDLRIVNGEKKRALFLDQDIPYTSLEDIDLDTMPVDEEVLLLVGLAPPWQADWFEGKRCYMLGLGVISKQKTK